MKKPIQILCSTLFFVAGCVTAQTANPPTTPTGEKPICLLSITPAQDQFTVVKKLVIKKGGYGSVDEAIAMLASKARKVGADAIVGYTGSQRFGFLPWQMVRPVVRGTAVKWTSTNVVDCVALGGTYR